MCAPRVRLIALLGPLGLFLGLLIAACGGDAEPMATAVPPTAVTERTAADTDQTVTETASYRIEVDIGPSIDMLSAEEGVTTMAQMALMSPTDQGQPVNRHFKVHVYDKSTGALVEDMVPTVTITDQATGTSRGLAADQASGASEGVSYVLACLLSKHLVFPHFGDNIYLPDGTHTVTVGVGEESAVFEDIVLETAG